MQTLVNSDRDLLAELNAMDPEGLLRWAFENHGERAGIVTSFQDTGCVMIDMAGRVAPGLRVLTIDSLRLPQETYDLIVEIETRYGIRVERFVPDAARIRRMVAQHGEFLFFDTKAKQEYCCTIRKVEPNIEALRTLDVWITGLRRDHSDTRGATPKAVIIEQEWGPILKLAPLADWDGERVREYTRANDVPYNKLYDKGYTSIGCVVCTTPTLPHEDPRAGRWRWFNHIEGNDKECGIHTQGSGI